MLDWSVSRASINLLAGGLPFLMEAIERRGAGHQVVVINYPCELLKAAGGVVG